MPKKTPSEALLHRMIQNWNRLMEKHPDKQLQLVVVMGFSEYNMEELHRDHCTVVVKGLHRPTHYAVKRRLVSLSEVLRHKEGPEGAQRDLIEDTCAETVCEMFAYGISSVLASHDWIKRNHPNL